MFDLEQAITEWRERMKAAGIQAPVPLEELEIHLREEIEQRVKAGLKEQEAFHAAVWEIGQGAELKTEFLKAGGFSGWFGGDWTTRTQQILGALWMALGGWSLFSLFKIFGEDPHVLMGGELHFYRDRPADSKCGGGDWGNGFISGNQFWAHSHQDAGGPLHFGNMFAVGRDRMASKYVSIWHILLCHALEHSGCRFQPHHYLVVARTANNQG